MTEHDQDSAGYVAIIGMSGRFPGAPDVDTFWQNLCAGKETITFFDEQQLASALVDPALSVRPDYVPAAGVLDGVEDFDAEFFRYSPREAELMDPQHRLFLECAWQAMENAGYDPTGHSVPVGVYAGTEMSSYLLHHVLPGRVDRIGVGGDYDIMIGNTKDFLPLRVSYRLGLTGPSVCVQTACSTSLVAVHQACQALLGGDCDVALAGGATVRVPQTAGYVGAREGILSPDGHCRAFDAAAEGTLPGNGVGVVVLKRLEDALADRDSVRAVIRGSAVNNDGSRKVGFTAPSVDGQSAVIAEALAVAEVPPESVRYVEAHGTGTRLGDPIEVAALAQVYGDRPAGDCALGSVKANIGHLDSAAGVAGLIKAVLVLENEVVPPVPHFRRANPALDLDNGPFFVNTSAHHLPRGERPLRAAVSSFGIGGTNAHVVLEQAPPPAATTRTRGHEVLVVSAAGEAAVTQAATELADHLTRRPELELADVAHTLQSGRKHFDWRLSVVCANRDEAVRALREEPRRIEHAAPQAPIAFLFSGQAGQHPGMGMGLYREEPVFREALDTCADAMRRTSDIDLLGLLTSASAELLTRTEHAQPALFAVQYALAALWRSWGITPAVMAGHSVGEYTAACLAGVLTPADAVTVLVERGRLIARLPPGAMVSVAMPAGDALALAGDAVDLAVVNGPGTCVLSGGPEAVDEVVDRLVDAEVGHRILRTSHAFHSRLLDPVLARFEDVLRRVRLLAPEQLVLSGLTGAPLTAAEATEPGYWVAHLRRTVRFDAVLAEVWARTGMALELGPGHAITELARAHPDRPSTGLAVPSLPRPDSDRPASATMADAVAALWRHGAPVDWDRYRAGRTPRRVPLPTYPFQRRRFWLEPRSHRTAREVSFTEPVWRRSTPPPAVREGISGVLLVAADPARAEPVAALLREHAGDVRVVAPGVDYRSALADGAITDIVHLGATAPDREGLDDFDDLVRLGQALGARADVTSPVRLTVVSVGLHLVLGTEQLRPARALVVGPCRVLPLEYPGVVCAHIEFDAFDSARAARQLLAEVLAQRPTATVAYRGVRRWTPARALVERSPVAEHGFRSDGTYLITGGLGGIGLAVARRMAARYSAGLVLVGRHLDDTARQVVDELDATGAQVLALTGDVTDERRMREVMRAARERFGSITGVLHCAGLPGAGLVQHVTPLAQHAVLAPKVSGTRILLGLSSAAGAEFVVLMSSHSALVGGLGQADYSAANAYLDAVAQAAEPAGPHVVSINWDTWRESGMAVRELAGLLNADAAADLFGDTGLSDDDGFAALEHALATGASQLVVAAPTSPSRRHVPAQDGAAHARPALDTPFHAPQGATEKEVAELWQDLLGIEQVGTRDDFFELGGHSLLATQLVSRLRDAFGVTVPMHIFYDHRTVSALAEYIDAVRWATSGARPAPSTSDHTWEQGEL